MEANILCEREEQTVLSNLFENLSALLQDCDDAEEKRKVRNTLRSMADTTVYMTIGEEESGKTSLLRLLFQDICEVQETKSGDICEYRWGEQEFTTPVSDGYQKRFLACENMRGLSIIDTKGINRIAKNILEQIYKSAENCSAILVIFDANHVNGSRLWDLIENFSSKKMIFFLTKCDMLSSEDLARNLEKVKSYMKESGISAPVFPVCTKKNVTGTVPIEEVRLFIREQLVGQNPILNRQRENVQESKKLLEELNKSFSLRKQQYLADVEILQKINKTMDAYVADHKQIIADLTGKLALEISKDIDSYQQEIISKMDPYKIKERFRTQQDFTDYLNIVNDNYKTMMTDSVNRKTMEALKGCLHDLETVFREAVGYFNTRENIIALNDRFYGSLSKSRKQIVAETKDTVVSAGEFYKTLGEASEELFLQIWEARKKYDRSIKMREDISLGTGAAGGGALTTAALGMMAWNTLKEKTIISALGAALSPSCAPLIIVGALAGSLLINKLAKDCFDPKAADKMERTTQKCMEQFKLEVDQTRKSMIGQVTSQITSIFENELSVIDGCFTEFRMSVNIDERKMPLLEQKLEETEKLLEKIDRF